jgi:hypothetical protein
MNASLPPSSIDDFLRFCPARAAMERAAATLPVRATPLIRGSSMTLSDWACEIRRFVYAPLGAGVEQQFLEGDRALRHAAGVLDDERVAGHQMRARHACELVEREVPWLDAEQDAERAALHVRMPDLGVELGGSQELFTVLRVVGQDVRAEVDLAAGLVDAFAHFQRRQLREVVDVVMHQLRGLFQDRRAIRVAGVLPGLEAGLGSGQGLFELGAVQVFEALQELAVVGVHALIVHCRSICRCMGWTAAESADPNESIETLQISCVDDARSQGEGLFVVAPRTRESCKDVCPLRSSQARAL